MLSWPRPPACSHHFESTPPALDGKKYTQPTLSAWVVFDKPLGMEKRTGQGKTAIVIESFTTSATMRHQMSRVLVAATEGHHVVLAGTDLHADFALPNRPRRQVGGRALAGFGTRVWDTTSLHRSDARAPPVQTSTRSGRCSPAVARQARDSGLPSAATAMDLPTTLAPWGLKFGCA